MKSYDIELKNKIKLIDITTLTHSTHKNLTFFWFLYSETRRENELIQHSTFKLRWKIDEKKWWYKLINPKKEKQSFDYVI